MFPATRPTSITLAILFLSAGHGGHMEEIGKLGAYAIKRVAAGAYLPTPWLFEPAKCPDDKADYCLGHMEAPLQILFIPSE